MPPTPPPPADPPPPAPAVAPARARALLDDLRTRLAALDARLRLDAIFEQGVPDAPGLFACIARDGRTCRVGVVARSPGAQQLSYALALLEAGEVRSSGLTWSADIAAASVVCWLRGDSLSALQGSFDFLDAERRALRALADHLLPALRALGDALAPAEIGAASAPVQRLRLAAGDRRCDLVFERGALFPVAQFFWRDPICFEEPARDRERIARLARRWLVDGALPSTLAREFPGVTPSAAAAALEAALGAGKDFLESWDTVTEFYRLSLEPPGRDRVLAVLEALRALGLDGALRASLSRYTLVLSRARRPRLRPEQAYVALTFFEGFVEVATNIDGPHYRWPMPPDAGVPDLEPLLRRLEAVPID